MPKKRIAAPAPPFVQQTISLTLPFPPSMNHYWRHNKNGQHFISADGSAYRDSVGLLCKAHMQGDDPLKGVLAVRAVFYRPEKRGDLDNMFKVLFDALKGTLYVDDSQIVELRAYRLDDKADPRVMLRLRTLRPGWERVPLQMSQLALY